MQIISDLAAFEAIENQLYESQALPSFLSLSVASNSNTIVKFSSMFITKARIKLSSLKKEDKYFEFFITYT